eukprot:c337_g1_i2 orf=25-603(+)
MAFHTHHTMLSFLCVLFMMCIVRSTASESFSSLLPSCNLASRHKLRPPVYLPPLPPCLSIHRSFPLRYPGTHDIPDPLQYVYISPVTSTAATPFPSFEFSPVTFPDLPTIPTPVVHSFPAAPLPSYEFSPPPDLPSLPGTTLVPCASASPLQPPSHSPVFFDVEVPTPVRSPSAEPISPKSSDSLPPTYPPC